MLMVTVWPLVILAALLAPATLSSEGSESRSKWTRTRHWLRSTPPPPFFAGDRRPEGLPNISRGTEIEQTLPNDPPNTPPYFVSLFDAIRNIPFYSAYKVTPSQAVGIVTDGKPKWRNPKDANGQGIPVDDAYSAAIKTDGQPLTRGHMNPSGINSFNTDFKKATFTLTNAAPQFNTSNRGPWEKFEKRIRKYAKSTCGVGSRSGTLYLLTGTSNFGLIPGPGGGKPVQDTTIPLPYPRTNFSKGVTLVTPRAVWTAGCCVWEEPDKILRSWWPSKKAESFAVMSNNQRNYSLLHQTEMRVTDLEALLTSPESPESPGVNLFPGDGNCRKNNVILPP